MIPSRAFSIPRKWHRACSTCFHPARTPGSSSGCPASHPAGIGPAVWYFRPRSGRAGRPRCHSRGSRATAAPSSGGRHWCAGLIPCAGRLSGPCPEWPQSGRPVHRRVLPADSSASRFPAAGGAPDFSSHPPSAPDGRARSLRAGGRRLRPAPSSPWGCARRSLANAVG